MNTFVCRYLNPLKFGRVGVLLGGTSAERAISCLSGQAVLAALKSLKIEAVAIDPKDPDWLERLSALKIDRVFIALHGPGGEDGQVQALLAKKGIPYTGSRSQASALAMDKLKSKALFAAHGLPTPPYMSLEEGFSPEAVIATLGLPLIVKPVAEGSSLGVTKVEKSAKLYPAWQEAHRYGGKVLAEKWIDGEEFTVGILAEQALPVVAVGWSGSHQLYDYQAKYFEQLQSHCPADLKKEDSQYVQQLSLQAFQALGCSGWGRVDLMRDRENRFWLLEVNTIPGLTEHSFVPMAAQVAGLSFQALIWFILEQTLEDRNDCGMRRVDANRKQDGHAGGIGLDRVDEYRLEDE